MKVSLFKGMEILSALTAALAFGLMAIFKIPFQWPRILESMFSIICACKALDGILDIALNCLRDRLYRTPDMPTE